MQLDIVAVGLPNDIDDGSAEASLFSSWVQVRNEVRRHAWGGDDSLDFGLRESFVQARDSKAERQHRFAALLNGRVVGVCRVEVSLHELDAPAMMVLGVLPEHRRRGIGSALMSAADAVIAEEGRATTQIWPEHVESPGPRLTASTGIGSVPAANAEVIALTNAGFTLEQAERISRFTFSDTSIAAVQEALQTSERHAQGYRLETWQGPTPVRLLDTMARLGARMSTDAPAGGMDVAAETWDAARLADFERIEHSQGRRWVMSVAFDGEEAVAYTKLMMPATASTQAIQQDTLVHADHRGHRLGTLVKASNLLLLRQHFPEYDRVITWNAAENTHMLTVNEQLGFVPVLIEGGWQRRESGANG